MPHKHPKYLQHILLGATAFIFAGAQFISPRSGDSATASASPVSIMPGIAEAAALTDVRRSTGFITEAAKGTSSLAVKTETALAALAPSVHTMSHPSALANAFNSYFAYKAEHPDQVRKPYLYFVDYGLPSTNPRGYVFDMDRLVIVDGPFTVAHGRGSATPSETVPTRFSNVHGSNATSLGLYLAQETYNFSGKASGKRYTSVGLRLKGLSKGFNDNARTRGVVAHGAPYVSATRAGRSEGCPAVTQERARTLMPKLSNGGMVFLFAPDTRWMAADPWLETAKMLAANEAPVAARRAN
ncbi:MAG: murein L,D-transpeptidase catalytic domain family protein [Gemmatimonadaceae bacterium]|nr:murein L,D-transpeptidase catalytic domain family protein [Gemmatimonadaceae bacterium]